MWCCGEEGEVEWWLKSQKSILLTGAVCFFFFFFIMCEWVTSAVYYFLILLMTSYRKNRSRSKSSSGRPKKKKNLVKEIIYKLVDYITEYSFQTRKWFNEIQTGAWNIWKIKKNSSQPKIYFTVSVLFVFHLFKENISLSPCFRSS